MKKGIKTLIVGIIIFIVGAIIVPFAVIFPVFSEFNNMKDTRFLVPGVKEFEVDKAGKYYLWNEYVTFYKGVGYDVSKKLPNGVKILVRNSNGEILKLKDDIGTNMSTSSSSKNSIGYVEVTDSGKVSISVTGDIDRRVVSFSESTVFKIVGKVLMGIGLCILFSAIGIGIIIWGSVKLMKPKKNTVEV